MSLADVLGLLRCPHCGDGLSAGPGTVRCHRGHSFDVARQGYLGLLPGDAQTGTADTAAMVAAREAVQAAGLLNAITRAVADAAERAAPAEGAVVDLGAGTGHHLAAVLERLPGRAGLALDLSRHALRRAARAHPRIGAASADTWRALPVRDGVAAVALCVFAPRNAGEIARILVPDGALVVATPTGRHLEELVEALGLLTVAEDKQERVRVQLQPHLEEADRDEVVQTLEVDRPQARALAAMGPSARHLEPRALDDLVAALPSSFAVTVSVRVSVFRAASPTPTV